MANQREASNPLLVTGGVISQEQMWARDRGGEEEGRREAGRQMVATIGRAGKGKWEEELVK